MEIKKNTVYRLPVKRVEYVGGRKYFIVVFEGVEYRVRKYDHQPDTKTEVSCVSTDGNDYRHPVLEQEYSEVLKELYIEGNTYPFRICRECVDNKTGAFYYFLSDDFGFYHRVYTTRNPLFREGGRVDAKVLGINKNYLSLELILPEPERASYTLGDVINQKQGLTPSLLDFSVISPFRDSTLRDYQIDNKKKIYEAWQRCRSVMLQMPTGTGKTRLFVSIARDIFDYGASIKKAFKVLILAHRRELIEQISDHLGHKYRLAHGLIISQNIEQKKFAMQVGSVPTLNRRLDRWEDKLFDVIIIDEAHHVKAKSYKKIIDLFPNAKILGVTATPYRLNKAGFRPEFDELILSPSVAEFIKQGYLCEYDYYSIRPNSALQKEIDTMKLDFEGDYKESEMMRVVDKDCIRADILGAYLRFANGKKCILYTINRSHNLHLCEKFRNAGIKAEAIDSDTPKEDRDKIVNRFKWGQIQVLFNVNIFSEGFDCPDVEAIQLARPTKSLSMYLQQVRRGLRPPKDKDPLVILDNVGLYNKFGFPSARRKWKYHFEGQDVDESPASHSMEKDEDRIVRDIFEGQEEITRLHASTDEVVPESTLSSIVRDYHDSFFAFATQSIGSKTVQGYVHNIESYLDGYITKHLNTSFKSLFNTVDTIELEETRKKLSDDADFVEYNESKHHVFSAALKKYIEFAYWFKEHKDDLPSLPGINAENDIGGNQDVPSSVDANDHKTYTLESSVSYEKKFYFWLRSGMYDTEKYSYGRYSSTVSERIIQSIKNTIDGLIRWLIDDQFTSLFYTKDPKVIISIHNDLLSQKKYIIANTSRRNILEKAMGEYIQFASSYPSDGSPDIKGNGVPSESDNQIQAEEIDRQIREIEQLINLLEKNKLIVGQDIAEKYRNLKLKKNALLANSILEVLKHKLVECKLDDCLSFTYSGTTNKLMINNPTLDSSINDSLEEVKSIIELMTKNNLSIPDEVTERKGELEFCLERSRRIIDYQEWASSFLARTDIARYAINVISYNPNDGFAVRQGEPFNRYEDDDMSKPFVIDRTPAVATKGKALLRVDLGDGRILDKGTATDIFVAAVEAIGIEKVKALNIMTYGSPIIAATPHPKYLVGSKKLSNGDYLITLSTTERKMQLINSIAKYYGLAIRAEVVDSIV